MKKFKNKVVVITGAASGMGRAYAIEFAKLGAKVAICDLDEKGLSETLSLIQVKNKRQQFYSEVFDVSDATAMFKFADHVKDAVGPAHVIINNAGISGGSVPVWELSIQKYEKVMQVNFFSVVYGTQAFLPQLIANKEGAIVNVSSVFGLIGTPNSSDYCASKFAVRGFTEALMVELEDTPISVHLVHPGGIKTDIAKGIEDAEAFANKYLKTPAIDIARYVIKGIQKGQPRLVFGHQSSLIWWGSWAAPLKIRNKFIRYEMSELLDPAYYSKLDHIKK